MKPKKKIVLCILDGWGARKEGEDNAIHVAKTPNYERLLATYPHALLQTSGLAVGLPDGQMGNSEVGHMNIGAGRVILQDLPRIETALREGSLAKHELLHKLAEKLTINGGVCHLMGLLSPGGVHAHQDHILALAKILSSMGVKVWIHAFLDGRDTPPESAVTYMGEFLTAIEGFENINIGTISGRYYAMDRDKRWDRVEKAYQALVDAKGERNSDPISAIEESYAKDVSDEFVLPTVIGDYAGMAKGDALLMANFRADRAREILTSLVDVKFDGFDRERVICFSTRLGMVEYSTHLNLFLETLFPPVEITDTLGEIISKNGLRQLRLAETEKYAHVTFFLNGGREGEYDGEDRILVPSPKVATYDLQPEMSAPEVTRQLVKAIRNDTYDLIVVNYANADMVGHTGDFKAALKAVETLDEALGQVSKTVEETGGVLLITADHGNIEKMKNGETHAPHTAHTTLQVPLILIGKELENTRLDDGKLADLAPTILHLMGIPQPSAMEGDVLVASPLEEKSLKVENANA